MALGTGERLGPYEILAPIGKGGMGEVYRARDTRLDRIVAIKVANERFSERFDREARAIASLNHPHICHLYDVGPNYLVMEFIEGATLQGPLPRAQAVAYGVQILDALEAAHTKGIVHRDLKPGNVMVTEQGVKLLDFGLAKLKRDAPSQDEETRSMELTQVGAVMGTPAYMAPEQWGGRPADARSDIYAFGCLLYEMLTGQRAGRERPPLKSTTLERIVRRCLANDPEQRWQSAAEVKRELGAASRKGKLPRIAVAGGVLAAVLITAAFFLARGRPAAALTDRDTLVLADFTNLTNNPVFGGALRQALTFEVEESPFLKIMDAEQVNHALEMLGHKAGEPISAQLAHDVCIREHEKATLEGSIAAIGHTYLLSLAATNCQTGQTLAREEAQAGDQDHVLEALAKAARGMRARLGESLRSIEKYPPAYENAFDVTTASLEALQVFAAGSKVLAETGSAKDVLAYLKEAVQLDPNFAMAYLFSSSMSSNLGDKKNEEAYADKAYALIGKVRTERERLWVMAVHYKAFGDVDKAIETYEVLLRSYPRDAAAHVNLGGLYAQIGQDERVLDERQAAAREAPTAAIGEIDLVSSYERLERIEEARAAAQAAVDHGLDLPRLHLELLEIAYVQGDHAGQEKQIQWFTGKPEESQSLRTQATAARFAGLDGKARELYRRAGEEATAAKVGIIPQCSAVKEMGLVGAPLCNLTDPETLEEQLKHRPDDTSIKRVRLPLALEEAALVAGDSAKALELLKPALPYERANGDIPYEHGLALLRLKRGKEAAAEFQKILDRKLWYWGGEGLLRSYFGAAEGSAMAGDTERARKTYQDLLTVLKDADPDNPYLLQARKELAALH